jgi:phenylpyruvate tautomerase PptA (4-oxalocrotonate tautomerase family)
MYICPVDYNIVNNPACKLRFEEELSSIASRLTRKQKDEVLTFIDYLLPGNYGQMGKKIQSLGNGAK